MKTSFHLPLAALVAVFSLVVIAVAEPPPRNPSDSGAVAGPIPSPGRPGSGYPKPLGQLVFPATDDPSRQPRFTRNSTDAAETNIASIQRALKRRGYYAGAVDGAVGSGTKAAIRGFRRDHGLAVSTEIDRPLLRALGM